MNTEEAEKQLKPYLIGDLTPKEEAILEGHLDVNEAAQWYHQRYYRQTLPIVELPTSAPSEGVLEDLFAKARKELDDPAAVVPTFGRLLKIEFAKIWKYAAVLLIALGACLAVFLPERKGSEQAGLVATTNLNSGDSASAQFTFGEVVSGQKGFENVLQVVGGLSVYLSEDAQVKLTKGEEKVKNPLTNEMELKRFYNMELFSGEAFVVADPHKFDSKHALQLHVMSPDKEIATLYLNKEVPTAVQVSQELVSAWSGDVVADGARVAADPTPMALSAALQSFRSRDFGNMLLSQFVDTRVGQAELVSTKPKKLVKSKVLADGTVEYLVEGSDNKVVVRRSDSLEQIGLRGKLLHQTQIEGKTRIYVDDEGQIRYFDLATN
ncbi:MAG: hypothetical protein KDB07_10700 [Planctomycetes bacterium]|nr:hypothetical protein [Planctomycetota bacterium]